VWKILCVLGEAPSGRDGEGGIKHPFTLRKVKGWR